MEKRKYQLLKNNINHDTLARLDHDRLMLLCDEIRSFLISHISKTGGHLASNLGVVELTVMLHRAFDFSRDRLLFDVGHQSYVHKILTGRMDAFNTLRQFGGLSGFPKRSESKFDIMDTGHSSTSLSAALGLAAARDISGESYHVVAVIGDGALTGGLAFEALNNIGQAQTPLIIILNDNEMSISKNVGALSKHLTMLRTSAPYTSAKFTITKLLKSIPGIGEKLYLHTKNLKERIKYFFVPGTFFESMGITYFGPIDGHDPDALDFELDRAKKLAEPVIIHVRTKKGKGYTPAELTPEHYHGVAPFDPSAGINTAPSDCFSTVVGQTLCDLAKEVPKLVAVCPAMTEGCGLSAFAKKFPDRYFDCGIAEEHAVTFAAGLATAGMIPVVTVYSSFMQRAFDMLIHDAAISNSHIIFCIDRAGLVGADGETHQGIFDLSYLSLIPNMTVLSPASFAELSFMLHYAVCEHDGPIAIRYPKGKDTDVAFAPLPIYSAQIVSEGSDITICAEGQMVKIALEATQLLRLHNVSAEVINIRSVKPIDFDTIKKSYKKTGVLSVLEANTSYGGIGHRIAAELCPGKCLLKSFPDSFIPQGTVDELMHEYGMDAQSICDDILSVIGVLQNEA